MFDLEQAIADWRQQMLAAGIKSPAPLEELEIHLREEIEQQMFSGANKQGAFENAVARIGRTNSLQQEFQKINNFSKAEKQRRAAAIISTLILGCYAVFFSGLLLKFDLTINERLLGFAAVAAMLLSVFIAWRILPRFFPVITNKTVQSAIGLIGGISGMVWFFVFVYLVLPRCNFTPGQLVVALFWALIPVITLPTASFLVIDKSERQHITLANF